MWEPHSRPVGALHCTALQPSVLVVPLVSPYPTGFRRCANLLPGTTVTIAFVQEDPHVFAQPGK